MRLIDLWDGIRKRVVATDRIEEEAVSNLISTDDPFKHVICYCLERLNECSAGTALYILDCLWPDDFGLLLDLIRLDLSWPHQHRWILEKDIPLKCDPYEDLLALLRARTSIIPVKAYPHFWLELTKCWLLTCPVDPDYYQDDEAGKEMFCQKLRGELVERILRID